MTYKVGDTVLYTNAFGYTYSYIIISILNDTYYNIALPLKSRKLPKRTFKTYVEERDLNRATESLCDMNHIGS